MTDLIYALDQVKVQAINGFVAIALGVVVVIAGTFLVFVKIIRGNDRNADKKD